MVRVGKEREAKTVLGVKSLLGLGDVRADPDCGDVQTLEIVSSVSDAAGLRSAARGIRLGVEVDEHLAALEVGQADDSAVLVGQLERRGRISGSQVGHVRRRIAPGAGGGVSTHSRPLHSEHKVNVRRTLAVPCSRAVSPGNIIPLRRVCHGGGGHVLGRKELLHVLASPRPGHPMVVVAAVCSALVLPVLSRSAGADQIPAIHPQVFALAPAGATKADNITRLADTST